MSGTSEPRLLEAFLKAAQYLASLTDEQDVWDHLARLVMRQFAAAWVAFVKRDADGTLSVHHGTSSGDADLRSLLAADVRGVAEDVLESGFLASRIVDVPAPSMTVFLPIAEEHKPRQVLLIGHAGAAPLPKSLLDVYLAVAGLAGTTIERLHNEVELAGHRAYLEDLVRARTAELDTARRQNELILHSVREGICGLDLQGRITFVNPCAAQMVGWDPAELIGRDAHATFHDPRRDGSEVPDGECPVTDTLRHGGGRHPGDEEFVRRDGSRFPVEILTAPLEQDGRVVGAVMAFRDVAERRQAELERAITLEFLERVNRGTGTREIAREAVVFLQGQSGCDAVGIRLQEDGDFPYFESRGIPSDFQAEDASLCARDAAGRVLVDEAGNPVLECLCGDVIRGRFDPGQPSSTSRGGFWTNRAAPDLAAPPDPEGHVRIRDGCRRAGYRSVALLPLRAGTERLGLLQLSDVRGGRFTAESVAMWERLAGHLSVALAKSRAEEALRALAETLERRVAERTAEVEAHAERLKQLAAQVAQTEQRERTRLAKLLHDHLQQLLVGAKMHAGMAARRAVDPALLDSIAQVASLLDESLQTSRSLTAELSPLVLHDRGLLAALEWLARSMEAKHQLEVRLEIDPEAEPDYEPLRLTLFEAVRELLLNVVKHAGVRRATVRAGRGDGGTVRLEVEDEGLGFPGDVSGDEASTGFGLFGMSQRIEYLGGRVEVRSGPGIGTRVTLTAPTGLRARPARVPFVPVAPVRGAARAGKIRVLLVDDHVILRQGLAAMLGLEPDIELVGEASDGAEGVESAARLRPDVVVMDVSMPVMNGVEATRRIRATVPGVQVIGLSLHETGDMARAMAEAGAVAYHNKAAPADQLVRAIRDVARPASAAKPDPET